MAKAVVKVSIVALAMVKELHKRSNATLILTTQFPD
jgi:hypothetical protein